MSLRDTLLASLTTLPGTRTFHIHVLLSAPRKHSGLFPYAHPRPRTYLQDLLVLLSEQLPESPRVFVTAIEASVYSVPATSCGVLYISKVDSSGHASAPSPTATLVRTLLAFYGDPSTRPIDVRHLWLQLFARAQSQYLFPNSAEYTGKRPLGDVQLCVWWKRIFSEVIAELNSRTERNTMIKPYYVLPGYNELDAIQSLDAVRTRHGSSADSPEWQWTYGHPYLQSDIPLPCPPGSPPTLGHFIPSFDDDPKSRFLDEIAHTTDGGGVTSPKVKRRKPDSSAGRSKRDEDEDEQARDARRGELAQVTAEEFWERMSFRQECISGVVTAFFAAGFSAPARGRTGDASPLTPQPGQVPPRMVRRVVATLLNHHEFSTPERAARATETLEEAIKGLCEDLASAPEPARSERFATPEREPGSSGALLDVPRTPPRRPCGAQLADVSPNPFPEPVASLETYHSYIYGSVAVSNPPLPPKAPASEVRDAVQDRLGPPVTVLAVRKKRKTA